MERARFKTGETVLVNGATETAGRLAVQLAKYLGAAKVIATGRNEQEPNQLESLGADVVIQFTSGPLHPSGAKRYEQVLITEFSKGINIVVDCPWGESAKAIIVAIAKAVEDAKLVRLRRRNTSRREHRTSGSRAPFLRHRVDGWRSREYSLLETPRFHPQRLCRSYTRRPSNRNQAHPAFGDCESLGLPGNPVSRSRFRSLSPA